MGILAFRRSNWIGRDPGSASGVYFEVDDVTKTVADLRAKGVEVTHLEDAEGNKVSIHQITVSR